MNKRILLIAFFASFSQGICFAQSNPAKVVEDFKPSSVNQPGKQFPQVNSERCVRTSISAPEAKKVQLDIGGVKYDLIKDDKGIWTGESAPQDEGLKSSTNLAGFVCAKQIPCENDAKNAISKIRLFI